MNIRKMNVEFRTSNVQRRMMNKRKLIAYSSKSR